MIEVKDIYKSYGSGKNRHEVLKGIHLSFRENEFVAILGPSGSGKTTLLNVIGGLDHYDSGDLIVNNISTRGYSARDWDSYRNHSIGFIFQSYNLIQHQNILSNVEMALTISGVSGRKRRDMAVRALEKVGLADHLTKRPNQLSGGQMQRVAIARALVNNPPVVLADEPTGALDSKTSVQVMELLKEVAKDRLIIMVTHNPELAEQYATRIITLKDGEIISDTDPYIPEETKEAVTKNMGHSSMNVFTALSLSFQNLWTIRSRTLLTAFAGSIGIIGIALISALSSGVDSYIDNQEANMGILGKETDTVSYTDTLGTVMSTVTRIITIITSALIATVAVSLVVSSIMIGVITYISVLERRKEIGILRAMGASRHNISQIFNAETFITGLLSGCMGVGLAYVLIVPLNAFLHGATQITDINAFLPFRYALILIAISVVLTTIGGIIPAHNASKSDPVEALRTE